MADAMDFLEALDDELIGGEIDSYPAVAKVLNDYVDGRVRAALEGLRVEYSNHLGSTSRASVILPDAEPAKKAEEPQPAPAPEPPRWSTEPPTKPGLYWTRPCKYHGSMSLASVADRNGLKFRLSYGDMWYKLDEGGVAGEAREWIGPVCRGIVNGDVPPALPQPFSASAWGRECPKEMGLYYMRYGPHGDTNLVYVDYDRLFRRATPEQTVRVWMGCVTETERGAQWIGPLPVPPPPGKEEPVQAEEKQEEPPKEEPRPVLADYVGDSRYLVVDLETKQVVTTLPGVEPTPLQWTIKKPTRSGSYWLRNYPEDADPVVADVTVDDDGTAEYTIPRWAGSYKMSETTDVCQWAGPIPLPGEEAAPPAAAPEPVMVWSSERPKAAGTYWLMVDGRVEPAVVRVTPSGDVVYSVAGYGGTHQVKTARDDCLWSGPFACPIRPASDKV